MRVTLRVRPVTGAGLERPTTLEGMWSKRQEVDYALRRRHTLTSLRGRTRTISAADVCDADPLLLRAARYHGEASDVPCPICDHAQLARLHYVFGDQLGQYSGRIKSKAELDELENEYGEFKVCVVEVCTECGWNHMISSFLLGDGVVRRPPRRQTTVEDIYG